MNPQALLDWLGEQQEVDLATVQKVLDSCDGADPQLIESHFGRVRNLSKYLRDFRPDAIAVHVRLLSGLNDQRLVALRIRPTDSASSFEIIVAGIDLVGVSACITACLSEMGFMILTMEVVTYEPTAAESRGPQPPATATTLASKYVIVLHVTGSDAQQSAEQFEQNLERRLRAAYWHLVRGDVRRARQESEQQDELAGLVLDDRFRLERRLTEGGMGAVYLATQLDLDRQVIVKLLRREYTHDQNFVKSFQRETRLLAQAHSPYVVQVYAAGIQEDRCWMAQEYMTGGDVYHWITRYGPPPPDLAARWLRESLAGLWHIHRDIGLIHCDIKPGNLLLDAGQNLKISDFGLSQIWRLTYLVEPDATLRGTPLYMAPEQARGEQLDERSDLYSLGSAFFHIVAGVPAFRAAGRAELLAKVARAERESLKDVAPGVPAPLAVIVERFMQANPWERYQQASVALADLESYLHRGVFAGVRAGAAAFPSVQRTARVDDGQPATNSHHQGERLING